LEKPELEYRPEKLEKKRQVFAAGLSSALAMRFEVW
jgi:hypothetical protein